MPAVLERVKENKLDLLNDLIDGKVLKECSKCKEIKDIDNFSYRSSILKTYLNQCKSCCKAYRKEYEVKNKRKILEYATKYRKNNPHKIEQKRKKVFESNKFKIMPSFNKQCRICLENKDALTNFKVDRHYLDGYRNMCKSCYAIKSALYKKQKKDKNSRDRSKLRQILLKKDILNNYIKLSNNKCIWCERTSYIKSNQINTVFYTIDHWIPLSKGGIHKIDNLFLLCHSCNASKQDKLPEEFFGEHYKRINNERLRIISELNISNEIKELIENVGK